MLPWQEFVAQLGRQNVTLGQNVNINGVLQDSITSEFIIEVEGTITTVAATPAIEGLPALVQNVNLSGPLANYGSLNPINGISGPMLSEIAQFIRSNVSYSFGSLGTTGKFGVSVPCTFLQPRLNYPWSRMSCLPTNDMGSVNFTIQIANQAQVDTNATATFAASTLTVYVQQNEYLRNSVPALAALVPAGQLPKGSDGVPGSNLFMFIPSTLNYLSITPIQTTPQQQQLFSNSTLMLMMIRSFPTVATSGVATSRQSDTVAGGPLNLSVTSQGITIQDVNKAPRRNVNYYTMRKENLDNITDGLVTGNAAFQFNRGLDKIFQPSIGPNQIPLILDTVTTGTTNPRIDVVYQQITDSQNWLGLQ